MTPTPHGSPIPPVMTELHEYEYAPDQGWVMRRRLSKDAGPQGWEMFLRADEFTAVGTLFHTLAYPAAPLTWPAPPPGAKDLGASPPVGDATGEPTCHRCRKALDADYAKIFTICDDCFDGPRATRETGAPEESLASLEREARAALASANPRNHDGLRIAVRPSELLAIAARVAQLEATLAEERKELQATDIIAEHRRIRNDELDVALRAARLSAEQQRDALWHAAKAIGLCACTVITGGAVARSPDCPLHSSLTEFAARRTTPETPA